MNDLTDLLRRATDDLEPTSTDLVERGMRRGAVLRRRRTALRGFAATGAVLATAGIIVGGNQLIGSSSGTPVAGPPAAVTSTAASAVAKSTRPVTPNDTLQTLRSLVPAGLTASQPRTWGDNFIGASYLVDDGKGASLLEVQVMTRKSQISCANEAHPENCTVRPDGTIVLVEHQPGRSQMAAINSVQVRYPDGRIIVLASGNSTAWKKAPVTRPQPLLTVAQLTALAENQAWRFPPVGYGKDLGR